MTKTKKNPYVIFENSMRVIGKILYWTVIVGFLAGFFILLPVTGIIMGLPWDVTWMPWILVVGAAATILLMWPIIILLGWVVDKYRTAKRNWERKNRGE